MMHPDTELRFVSPQIGFGVFATALIPKGTMTYVKDDLEVAVSPNHVILEIPKFKELVDKYSYIDEKGNHILSWDHGKYVNHCCQYNTISTGYGFEIAVRDIQPGEEITDEYGIFNIPYEMKLICSKPDCRGVITPEDFEGNYKKWDGVIKDALTEFKRVKQPLYKLVDDHTKQELLDYLDSNEHYKSVHAIKFNGVYAGNGVSH